MKHRKPRWNAADFDLLCRRYEAEGAVVLAAEMGRSHFAVASQARRCGLWSPTRWDRQAATRHNNHLAKTRNKVIDQGETEFGEGELTCPGIRSLEATGPVKVAHGGSSV